jgi:glycosyltransferase involved in cell wall biosynthesis
MIEILMSTFNGECFVEQQLQSILDQTSSDWRLTVRDDGSSDETVRIVQRYVESNPDRIRMLEVGTENLGACMSFARLMDHAESEYVMFSDQDDVWFPDKIARTFQKFKEMEERHGKNIPLMVFTDATVVDEGLNVMAPSMWAYKNSAPDIARRLNRLLLMNPANGCTMMVNRALLNRALPVPREAIMHDVWLVLVAAVFGNVGYVPNPTLFYRQHGKNESVTKQWGLAHIFRQLSNLGSVKAYIALSRKQAGAFLERYQTSLSDPDKKLMSAFAHLDERSFIGKRIDILRNGFFYEGFIRNIGWLLIC